jgi:serine protease Do
VGPFPEGVDSPAKRAGLEQGDVIITIDGQPVQYVAQLQQLVGFRHPGESVKVEVARKGGIRKVYAVRLMEQSSDEREAGNEEQEQPKPNTNDAVSFSELGASVQSLTPELAQDYELERDTRGLIVTEVDPNGPAYTRLFAPEEGGPDIIQSVEGVTIRSESDLRTALKAAGKGTIVSMRVYNGRQQEVRLVRIRLE